MDAGPPHTIAEPPDADDDNLPGHAKRFPEESCARLEDIEAGKWSTYEPRPVRILASRFIQLAPMVGPFYFPLKRAAIITACLTVSASSEYADRWSDWAEIVSNRR